MGYRRINHKMKLAQFVAISCLLAVSSTAPQIRRNQNNVNTKFFTGNNAIDSAAWGGNSVFCQPGVEPLQRRQPRWHQGRKPGNKHKVLPREQQSSWQRPPWFPWWVRSGCSYPLRSWEPLWLNTIKVLNQFLFFFF